MTYHDNNHHMTSKQKTNNNNERSVAGENGNQNMHDIMINGKVNGNDTTVKTNITSERVFIDDDNDDAKTFLNLQAIDGVRCLTCLGIIMFHTNMVYGVPLFLRSTLCFTNIFRMPIISLFVFQITWHLTIFWILSGFLCEYQLHLLYKKFVIAANNTNTQQSNASNDIEPDNNKPTITNGYDKRDKMNDVTISWKEFIIFFLNRLLRLYPLYVILPTAIFFIYRMDPRLDDLYTLKDYIETLLFIKYWNAEVAAGVVWSVQVDVHGYIAIILLFAFTYNYTYGSVSTTKERNRRTFPKRCILIVWYIVSLLNVLSCKPFVSQRISSTEAAESIRKYGTFGIDTLADKQLRLAQIDLHGGRESLHPTYDFHTNDEIRQYQLQLLQDTYFASILNHGSAMMLGSLLYVNLYNRQWQSSYSGIKLLFSFLFLILTGGWHSTSGIASYFFLDAILTIKPWNTPEKYTNFLPNVWNRFVLILLQFLSRNPVFQFLAPYTYGLYLFHLIPLAKRYEETLPPKIAAIQKGAKLGIDACQALADAGYAYNLLFLAKEFLVTVIVTLIISMIAHRIIEQPILRIRKQWLPKAIDSFIARTQDTPIVSTKYKNNNNNSKIIFGDKPKSKTL